jgi:hypothetical protein
MLLRTPSSFEGIQVTETFPTIVYVLCFLTSAACAWLLGRSYRRTGMRLLLWSSICFLLLAGNNVMLIFDLVIWPDDVDLRLFRQGFALAAVLSLIWGFIWEVEEE